MSPKEVIEVTNVFLVAKHKLGIILCIITIPVWLFAQNVFSTFRASFEASLATSQVNDSIIEYSLIQKMLYGDLGVFLINAFFLVVVILLLLPIIKDFFRKGKGNLS